MLWHVKPYNSVREMLSFPSRLSILIAFCIVALSSICALRVKLDTYALFVVFLFTVGAARAVRAGEAASREEERGNRE